MMKARTTPQRSHRPVAQRTICLPLLLACLAVLPSAATAADSPKTEANVVAEITFAAAQPHPKPFLDVTLDVVFADPSGTQKTVPAFWAGGIQWKVRYWSPVVGTHRYRTRCNETGDTGLHAVEGCLEVTPYHGENPFFKHGASGVGKGGRQFAHADGTPFFWLGDTWWKCLCQRMTWEGFQELTADRKAKGFNVVQIVCGPYPDEGFLEPRLANEGGLPYESIKLHRVNPK